MNQIAKIISLKNQTNQPYMSSGPTIHTDMDTFPYPRFYRGKYDSTKAIVFEREAGWEPRKDQCYELPFMEIEQDNQNYILPPINYFSYSRLKESEKLISGENLLKHR